MWWMNGKISRFLWENLGDLERYKILSGKMMGNSIKGVLQWEVWHEQWEWFRWDKNGVKEDQLN